MRVRVVLVRPRHPGNIGAAARAMKTMGLSRLHIVRPERFPDPQAVWLAAGADDVLAQAQVHERLEDALLGAALVAGLTRRRRELAQPPLDASAAAPELLAVACHQEVALLFGNEAHGLSNAELAFCHQLVTIPADPAYPSLNLAAAVQVMAYALRVAALAEAPPPSSPPSPPAPLARAEDLTLLLSCLERTLVDIGFLDPAHPKRLMPRLSRLLYRARLEKEEFDLLMGILKQIQAETKSKVD